MQIALDRRLEHAEDVAVHVVDGGDDEQQTTDDPAVIAGRFGGGRYAGYGHSNFPLWLVLADDISVPPAAGWRISLDLAGLRSA